ncbi:MAG: hypothetical protein WAU01_10230 [Saprospiraceae bacterium]
MPSNWFEPQVPSLWSPLRKGTTNGSQRIEYQLFKNRILWDSKCFCAFVAKIDFSDQSQYLDFAIFPSAWSIHQMIGIIQMPTTAFTKLL